MLDPSWAGVLDPGALSPIEPYPSNDIPKVEPKLEPKLEAPLKPLAEGQRVRLCNLTTEALNGQEGDAVSGGEVSQVGQNSELVHFFFLPSFQKVF